MANNMTEWFMQPARTTRARLGRHLHICLYRRWTSTVVPSMIPSTVLEASLIYWSTRLLFFLLPYPAFLSKE